MFEIDTTIIGRKILWTDVDEITSENVISVINRAMPFHIDNMGRIDFLLKYEKGLQPLQREKKIRTDIDIATCDNIANEVTNFKTSFIWGYPITLVQRDDKEEGGKDETKGINSLNEMFEANCFRAKQKELARFVEIGGIGYTYINERLGKLEEGDAPFEYQVLDPRFAFVIRSSYYIDRRIMLGVTFRIDRETGTFYFTAYTPTRRYEIINLAVVKGGNYTGDDYKRRFQMPDSEQKWERGFGDGFLNTLGRIPIVEWIRDYDRMGCFERQIPEMDALNIAESDIINDIDQTTQCIWHANDVEFPTETYTDEQGVTRTRQAKPQSNDWIETTTPKDGKQPFIKPLIVQYDYNGIMNMILVRRALILQKCNVPQRNDNSGGSTGVAMSDATGWSQAETQAAGQQAIMESCKMEEVKNVLAVVKKSNKVFSDDPVKKLKYSDIIPNVKRSKNFELVAKSNTLATLLSHGIDGLSSIRVVNLFSDPLQTYMDSKEGIEKYQKTIFKDAEEKPEEEKNGADLAQIMNSPVIDGMSKEKIAEKDNDKSQVNQTNTEGEKK